MKQLEANEKLVGYRIWRGSNSPRTLYWTATLLLSSCVNDGSQSFEGSASITAPTVVAIQSVVQAGLQNAKRPAKGTTPSPVVALREMRRASVDSVAKWRESLDKFAKVSRRKEASVVLSRIVLDAVSARSDAEYHEKIAQLPVVITDSAGVDDRGRAGYYRNYSVYGKTRTSVFHPTAGEPVSGLDASWPEVDEANPGLTEDEPSVASAALTWCVDDLPEGYWEGECATQAEIDDANSAMAALETEMDGVESDVAHAEYCAEHPEDYQTCADQEENTASDADGPVSPEWLEDGGVVGSAQAQWAIAADCAAEEPDANFMLAWTARESCAMEAAQAGIAAVAWWGSKVAARAVLAAATTSNAAGWAIFGAMTTGFALAGAAGSYITCLQS